MALFTFAGAGSSVGAAGDSLRRAKADSNAWTDEYWNASGYDKAAVTQALDRLIEAADAFVVEHTADIEVLRNQT